MCRHWALLVVGQVIPPHYTRRLTIGDRDTWCHPGRQLIVVSKWLEYQF